MCPGREHFYMLIINALQKIQAKSQAVLECHNIRMIALKKDTVMLYGRQDQLTVSTNYSRKFAGEPKKT